MDWINDFRDFIAMCLIQNPKQRPTAVELQQHKWIKTGGKISLLQRKIDTNAQTATSAMQTIETNTEYDEFDGSTMITPNDNGDGNAEYDESTMLVGSVL